MKGKTKLIRRVEQGEEALELLARVVDIYNQDVRDGTNNPNCYFCGHLFPNHYENCVYDQAVKLFNEVFDEGLDELFEWAGDRIALKQTKNDSSPD